MKLLDVISLGISFLSVVVSIVALVISKHEEKMEKAVLAKREENANKERFRGSGCETPPDLKSLRKKIVACSLMYPQRGVKVYKKTGQKRIIKRIKVSTPNNTYEAYNQMLVTYLRKLYPEAEEESILRMSDELQKSQADDFAENLALRAEEAKKRINALDKVISD